MKTRIEAARFAEDLLNDKIKLKKSAYHFGKVELRLLFDFIWEGEPREHDELLGCDNLRNNTAAKNKRFESE
jgi:hypothetical protein